MEQPVDHPINAALGGREQNQCCRIQHPPEKDFIFTPAKCFGKLKIPSVEYADDATVVTTEEIAIAVHKLSVNIGRGWKLRIHDGVEEKEKQISDVFWRPRDGAFFPIPSVEHAGDTTVVTEEDMAIPAHDLFLDTAREWKLRVNNGVEEKEKQVSHVFWRPRDGAFFPIPSVEHAGVTTGVTEEEMEIPVDDSFLDTARAWKLRVRDGVEKKEKQVSHAFWRARDGAFFPIPQVEHAGDTTIVTEEETATPAYDLFLDTAREWKLRVHDGVGQLRAQQGHGNFEYARKRKSWQFCWLANVGRPTTMREESRRNDTFDTAPWSFNQLALRSFIDAQ